MISMNYSWTKIARMLNISRDILYRRLEEYGISTDSFTNISASELDELLIVIKSKHPNIGEVMLQSQLLHIGVKVPRDKLRSSIHRTDHTNTVCRHSSTSVEEYTLLHTPMLSGISMGITK